MVSPLAPTRQEIVFTNLPELAHWAKETSLSRYPVRLCLNLPALPQQEQRYWEEQIEHAYNDCGCSSAAVALFGLILAAIAYGAVIGFEQPLWLVTAGTFITAIAALFTGKLLGLAWSRRALRRHVTQISHLVERSTNESFS